MNVCVITKYKNNPYVVNFRINPLSLVEIIAYVVNQYNNKKDAIAFLEKVEAKVKMNDEALALCKVSKSINFYLFVNLAPVLGTRCQ